MKYYIYEQAGQYFIAGENIDTSTARRVSNGEDSPSDLYDELRELKSIY